MITLDFILTILIVYGVVKLVGAMMKPSKPRGERPRMARREEQRTVDAAREQRKIVDATFEEIE